MARVYKYQAGEGGDVSFNMTPMIDCTFQLIIFFILASTIASQSLAKLSPPQPHESVAWDAEKLKLQSKIVVNVLSAAGDNEAATPAVEATGKEYQINTQPVRIGDIETLVKILRRAADDAKKDGVRPEDFYVIIRADKRVHYSYIVPVMKAAAEAGIEKMCLTALQNPNG